MNENKAPDSQDSSDQPVTPELPPEKEGFSFGQRALIYLVFLAVVFLLGFLPMWFKAGSRVKDRDAAQRELRLAQVQLALGSAAIDARRGEYEAARLAAVNFFTSLTTEMDRGRHAAFTPAQRDAMQQLLQQRDDLVTLLARSDPASAERLAAYMSLTQGSREVTLRGLAGTLAT